MPRVEDGLGSAARVFPCFLMAVRQHLYDCTKRRGSIIFNYKEVEVLRSVNSDSSTSHWLKGTCQSCEPCYSPSHRGLYLGRRTHLAQGKRKIMMSNPVNFIVQTNIITKRSIHSNCVHANLTRMGQGDRWYCRKKVTIRMKGRMHEPHGEN